MLSVSSTIRRHPVAHARAAGCLWLALGGWLFLFLATVGAVVPVDTSVLLLPYIGPPALLAVLVFAAGHRKPVAALSVIGGLFYAGMGLWNYLRAAEFERATGVRRGQRRLHLAPVLADRAGRGALVIERACAALATAEVLLSPAGHEVR